MDLWAIIPVKPFKLGKSRLAPVLGDAERADFNRRMFEHVLRVVSGACGAERTIVVGCEPQLPAQAEGIHVLREPHPGDLNRALALGARHAAARGAEAVMVLPADLPDLSGGDVDALMDALMAALGPAPICIIAPDTGDSGTNAFVLAPPDADFFHFGPDSFAAHVQAARTRGSRVRVVRRPGLAFDLDTPESYHAWLNRVGASA